MKSKITTVFILSMILLASCRKESAPDTALVGQWMSTAVYLEPARGWQTPSRFNESVSFDLHTRFRFFTDVPGGSGTYQFNNSSGELRLLFEADQYGNTSRSEIRRVEEITGNKLIISFEIPQSGIFYKTEYTRIR